MERITFNQIPNGMVEKLLALENYLKESSLELHLLELIRLRISQINKCAYCVDMHYKELKHAGETELRLSSLSIWHETPFFSKKEQTVLKFTEVLTLISSKNVTDEIFDSLNEVKSLKYKR